MNPVPTATHSENGKYSRQYLNSDLKKLGVMMMLACETAYQSYCIYVGEYMLGSGG
jgi:hypothetical protein